MENKPFADNNDPKPDTEAKPENTPFESHFPKPSHVDHEHGHIEHSQQQERTLDEEPAKHDVNPVHAATPAEPVVPVASVPPVASSSFGSFISPSEPVFEGPKLVDRPEPRGGSGTYLPEYLVMLLLLGASIGAMTTLLAIGIDSLIPDQNTADSLYDYSSGLDSFQIAWSLGVLLSSLPVFAWLFTRTRKAERNTPEIKTHRWRKIFLGAFLVVETLAIVGTIGGLIYTLVSRAIDSDSGNMFLAAFSAAQDTPWWQEVITALLTAAILAFTVFVMSRDYARKEV